MYLSKNLLCAPQAGVEPTNVGVEIRCLSNRPLGHLFLVGPMGVEPINVGLKVRCLTDRPKSLNSSARFFRSVHRGATTMRARCIFGESGGNRTPSSGLGNRCATGTLHSLRSISKSQDQFVESISLLSDY